MVLIYGGAYQGKRDFAKAQFGLVDEDFTCCQEGMALSTKALTDLEQYFLTLTREGRSVEDFLQEYLPLFRGKILLVNEVSCGVVPVDPLLRKWREDTARATTRLAREAEQVYRLYCGIATRLK